MEIQSLPAAQTCLRLGFLNPNTNFRPPYPSATWLAPSHCLEFAAAGTTAHRLASGEGGWVERLGEDVLISYRNEAALEDLANGLEARNAESDWRAARVFTRFLPSKNADRIAPVLQSGDASLPWTTVVTEAGIRYGLDLAAGYSHGLFLDQRLNRAKLLALRPRRMLNTFAYTCSFSVVAALAGAETLSVDLSRKSLDRGVQNLALNGITGTGHRAVVDDALELLPRLEAQGERYDAIILDPPTFSRGKNGRRWQVEDHFDDLLLAALEVAMPRCAILLSTNCTKLNAVSLEQSARQCARTRRRTVDFVRMGSPVDFPAGHGATTLWMMLR